MSLGILGTGSTLPSRLLTNFDLAKMVDTSDEWIRTRTGIRERRLCGEGENTLTMGVAAARAALEDAGVDAKDLKLIICHSVAPHQIVPPLACQIMGELGASCPAFDMNCACTGFLYELAIADAMNIGPALLVCSEQTSRYVDFTDRRICVLFGDGAGAAVTAPATLGKGLFHTDIRSTPDVRNSLTAAGINNRGESGELLSSFLAMDGQEVYKFAAREMMDLLKTTFEATGLSYQDFAYIIPHQANIRIIQSCSERLDIPWEKFYINIDHTGNISSATVPLALDELRRLGRAGAGDRILLAGFGAGWTAGAAALTL